MASVVGEDEAGGETARVLTFGARLPHAPEHELLHLAFGNEVVAPRGAGVGARPLPLHLSRKQREASENKGLCRQMRPKKNRSLGLVLGFTFMMRRVRDV